MDQQTPSAWAIDEALNRCYARRGETVPRSVRSSVHENPSAWANYIVLAEHIEKYEQPPVDPDLLRAREIAADFYGNIRCFETARQALSGQRDTAISIQCTLRALKEGRDAK